MVRPTHGSDAPLTFHRRISLNPQFFEEASTQGWGTSENQSWRQNMDPILYWNDVALEADRISQTDGMSEQTGPTLASRALAIVHLAMYDAYAGVVNDPGNLPSYLP